MEERQSFKKYEEILDKSQRHIISTKKLSVESTSKLETAGFSVFSYEAIEVELTVDQTTENEINALGYPLVFTSKNGVFAATKIQLDIMECYAISPVTVSYAEEAGFRPKGIAPNSKELAALIVQNGEKEVIHITTTDRREELQNHLIDNKVKLHSFVCYDKYPIAKEFKNFDALLIFAPSQLDAFLSKNKITNKNVFCIGPTTATYAISKGIAQAKFSKISSEAELVNFTIQHMTNE